MKLTLVAATAALLASAVLAQPALARSRHHFPQSSYGAYGAVSPSWYGAYGAVGPAYGAVAPERSFNLRRGDPGRGNGPNYQGAPSDRLSIWRNGRYNGNDPDERIRLGMMRDPRTTTTAPVSNNGT